MTVHEIEMRKPVRIPREAVEQKADYVREHKIALILLLVQDDPELKRTIVAKLQKQAA